MQLERATVTNRNTGNLEFADYRISKRYRKSRLKYFVNNYICNGVADRLCGLLSRSTILSIRFGHTSFARYLQFTDSLKLLLKEIISHRFPVHSISLCVCPSYFLMVTARDRVNFIKWMIDSSVHSKLFGSNKRITQYFSNKTN